MTLCLTSFCTNFPTANRDADKNQLVALTANKMSIESQRHSFSEAESTAQQSLGSSTSIVPFCSRQICTSTPDFKKKVTPRFQQTWRLRGRAGHGPHGLNSAAVRFEGAVHHLDSALKKRGGGVQAVELSSSLLSEGESMHAHACKMVALATAFSLRNASFYACMSMPCSFDS